MMLEIARMEDLEAICALYESTCAQMQAAGLNQWSWGEYPSRDIVREDLEAGRLYVARQGGAPICAVAIDQEQEEQYARVDWLFGTRPALPSLCRGRGAAGAGPGPQGAGGDHPDSPGHGLRQPALRYIRGERRRPAPV